MSSGGAELCRRPIRRYVPSSPSCSTELDDQVDHLQPHAGRPRRTSRSICTLATRGSRSRLRSTTGSASAATLGQRREVATARADGHVRLHARQDQRRLLTDHPLPGLRHQPGADPLGEPIDDIVGQPDGTRAMSTRCETTRVCSCSLGCARTTEPSGSSAPPPTSATPATVRLRSPGDSPIAFRPTCTRRLPPLWRDFASLRWRATVIANGSGFLGRTRPRGLRFHGAGRRRR